MLYLHIYCKQKTQPLFLMMPMSIKRLKSVLMGFGLDSDALHSPNEHYGLFNYYKGIETIPYFFSNFAK